MPTKQQKRNLKSRIELLEKEIFNLTGNEKIKAKTEYFEILKLYSKECGLEEPIYLTRI